MRSHEAPPNRRISRLSAAATSFGPAFPDSEINESVASGAAVTITGQQIEVTLSGNLPPPTPVTYAAVTTSTTIAAGGTSQDVFAVGDITTGAYVTNPPGATESLFINPTGGTCGVTASGATFEIQPGGTFTMGPATNKVTVNAATTGHVFSAARF